MMSIYFILFKILLIFNKSEKRNTSWFRFFLPFLQIFYIFFLKIWIKYLLRRQKIIFFWNSSKYALNLALQKNLLIKFCYDLWSWRIYKWNQRRSCHICSKRVHFEILTFIIYFSFLFIIKIIKKYIFSFFLPLVMIKLFCY